MQQEVRRRIKAREWRPGEMIPSEAELAAEFGCARATVTRALRGLAEAGLLDRRRKAGSRVALHPVRKATLDIPVLRNEIEAKGLAYCYRLLARRLCAPPAEMAIRMKADAGERLLQLSGLHLAGARPYVLEGRWINPRVVPEVEAVDFEAISPNEWLVTHVPFEGGDIAFSATSASAEEARILDCRPGDGLFVIERMTWSGDQVITSVRLVFAPGYRMHTQI